MHSFVEQTLMNGLVYISSLSLSLSVAGLVRVCSGQRPQHLVYVHQSPIQNVQTSTSSFPTHTCKKSDVNPLLDITIIYWSLNHPTTVSRFSPLVPMQRPARNVCVTCAGASFWSYDSEFFRSNFGGRRIPSRRPYAGPTRLSLKRMESLDLLTRPTLNLSNFENSGITSLLRSWSCQRNP